MDNRENNFLVVRLQLHGDEHDELPIFYEAADEIKRLTRERDEARSQLHITAGLLSTHPQFETKHPEEVLNFVKEAAK